MFRYPQAIVAGLLITGLATEATPQVSASPEGRRRTSVGGDRDMTRVLNLHGTVILDNGDPPPSPVTIERICGNYTYKEGLTNLKGEFSFQVGQNGAVFMDASTNGATVNSNSSASQGVSSNISPNALWDCELRTTLVGYRSDSISLKQQRNLDNPNFTLILHRVGDAEEAAMFSATTALAPEDAQKAYRKGFAEIEKGGNLDDAEKELRKAVDKYPRFAEAWFQLGRIYETKRNDEQAKAAYQQAIEADGNYLNPHERLFLMAARVSDWEQTAEITAHVIALNPYEFPRAMYYNAVANLELGDLETAERNARAATRVVGDGANPRAYYVLGMALGRQADFAGAAENLRTYLQVYPEAENRQTVEALIATADDVLAKQRIDSAR